MKYKKFLAFSGLKKDFYNNLEELSKDINDAFENLKSINEIDYPESEYEFEWEVGADPGDDSNGLELQVWRSETPDEKLLRIKKEEDQKQIGLKMLHDQELKKTQLLLAEDEADYKLFLELKKKYSHL